MLTYAADMETADGQRTVPVTRTARQRARAEVTAAILEAARRQLALSGAAALSLRAVARELGMPSSGVYRYVADRDELLTRLIVEAYDSLGEAVEASQGPVPDDDLLGRFAAACRAVRCWALANPHEYALIFGSPVPGYRAPQATVAAASRIPAVLADVLRRAADRRPASGPSAPSLGGEGLAAVDGAVRFFGGTVPPERMQAGLMVWAALFGAVSFELFGHFEGSVAGTEHGRAAFFEACIGQWAAQVGIDT